MIIRPLGNKIVVTRIVPEKTTSFGIILQSADGPDKAKVVAIGPEVEDVQVGDTLLVNWNKSVKAEDDNYVLPATEVIWIYDNE